MAQVKEILSIKGLRVTLPAGAARKFAVHDIDLQVCEGEIVCIVGESGSGKSVTAFSVMGLLSPHSFSIAGGEINLDGEELLSLPAHRIRELRGSRMAMIFQEPMTALNPCMTAGEQIEEVLATHTSLDCADRMARVIEVMSDVKLPEPEKLKHRYPHQLSGGQRQRVMIAMALALKPRLLIADEPTTALDVTTQAQILALIKELQRQNNLGVLFITHDFGVVSEIADRVAVMKDGMVVETGQKHEIMQNPQHAYTRKLIDAVPRGFRQTDESDHQAEAILRVRNLKKTYTDSRWLHKAQIKTALDGVSLSIRPGEILGVVGESGCGKSTLARCVARLIDPRVQVKSKSLASGLTS
jgi:peptide/nickel transport system ATP-binding protein